MTSTSKTIESLSSQKHSASSEKAAQSIRPSAPARLAGALSAAHDWIIRFDLGDDKYSYDRFPMNIADVPDRPDILLWSETRRELLAIELTCPGEDRIETAHQ